MAENNTPTALKGFGGNKKPQISFLMIRLLAIYIYDTWIVFYIRHLLTQHAVLG